MQELTEEKEMDDVASQESQLDLYSDLNDDEPYKQKNVAKEPMVNLSQEYYPASMSPERMVQQFKIKPLGLKTRPGEAGLTRSGSFLNMSRRCGNYGSALNGVR